MASFSFSTRHVPWDQVQVVVEALHFIDQKEGELEAIMAAINPESPELPDTIVEEIGTLVQAIDNRLTQMRSAVDLSAIPAQERARTLLVHRQAGRAHA